jgi:hypothetical protein
MPELYRIGQKLNPRKCREYFSGTYGCYWVKWKKFEKCMGRIWKDPEFFSVNDRILSEQ